MSRPEPGVDQCQRLAYRRPGCRLDPLYALAARIRKRSYGEPSQCGLLWGHAGRCVWFTPGEYLVGLAPLLHPLDPRGRFEPCPGCGHAITSIGADGPYWVLRDGYMTAAYGGPMPGAEREAVWRFEPCGCERREILPPTADQASTASDRSVSLNP